MNWLRLVGINIAVFLILVIFVDVFLRLVLPENFVSLYDYSSPLVPKVNAKSNPHIFNPDGTRTAAFDCPDGPVRKLLMVGDSNIEARYLPSSAHHPGQMLSDLLNKADSATCYQVDSFGVNGYGPDQSLFAVQTLTQSKSYDVIIFHVFADNDIGDLLRNNYAASEHGLMNDGYCITKQSLIEKSRLYRASQSAFYTLTGYWLDVTAPVASLPGFQDCVDPPAFKNIEDSQDRLMMAQIRVNEDRSLFFAGKRQHYRGDRYDIEIACGVKDEFAAWQYQQLVRVFDHLAVVSEERGFEVIVLIEPSEWDMTYNHEENPESLSKFCSGYSRTNLSSFVLRAYQNSRLKGEVVSLVDLFENCSECYFSKSEMGGDNHWSPVGIAKAMNKLSAVLDRQSAFRVAK